PDVGASSSARIDSSVDLPQPDGPETEMYSPRSMSRVTSSSARVSSSASPLNTLLTPSSRISGRFGSASSRGRTSRFHQANRPSAGLDVNGRRIVGSMKNDVAGRVTAVSGFGGDEEHVESPRRGAAGNVCLGGADA